MAGNMKKTVVFFIFPAVFFGKQMKKWEEWERIYNIHVFFLLELKEKKKNSKK